MGLDEQRKFFMGYKDGILTVEDPTLYFKDLRKLKQEVEEYCVENFVGKQYRNKEQGIVISVNQEGIDEMLWAATSRERGPSDMMDKKKCLLSMKILDKIIEDGVQKNYGRMNKDPNSKQYQKRKDQGLRGARHFTCKVRINNDVRVIDTIFRDFGYYNQYYSHLIEKFLREKIELCGFQLLEMTVDQLQQSSSTSNLTKGHLDYRMSSGISDIQVVSATWFTKNNFIEIHFKAKATKIQQKAYSITIRLYNVNDLMMKSGDFKQSSHQNQEKVIKEVFHQCDIRFQSDDPSWTWQGAWEDMSKKDLTIYKYKGPKGKDIWHDRHNASGGLSDPDIHLTKHISQILENIDSYVRPTVQKLKIS